MAADETSYEDGTPASPPAQQPLPSQHGKSKDSSEREAEGQGTRKREPEPDTEDTSAAPQDRESPDRRRGVGADRQRDPEGSGSREGPAAALAPDPAVRDLPAASELAEYEQVLKGAAESILKMAQEASAVQNESLKAATKAEVRQAKVSQGFTIALTVAAFITSVCFFVEDNSLAGVIFIIIPLVLLAKSSPREPPVDE
ncbi:MAG TPA: DUF2335 domain-containing protein [Nocardioidaceae bacterium]|nr:DUF2335 domain-containing protein [Nocardioidaceae bacterium]